MKHASRVIVTLVALVLLASPGWAQGAKPLKKCAPDAVVSGTVCMDTYEASVWRVPDVTGANQSLAKKIQAGKATAADLAAGGATQLGIGFTDDYAPCADSGQNCADDIYAVSLPARGAYDMVGNLYEWVADWVPRSTACGTWSAGVSPTGDDQCLASAATTGEPGALLRGGTYSGGSIAGPLTVVGFVGPSNTPGNVGFRCAR